MNEKRAIMRWMAAAILAVSAVLAGCGGGGNAGCTNFGGTGCDSSSGSNASSGGSSGSSTSQVEPAALVFDSALPADKSIVLKGAGGNGRTETAVLKFLVLGVDGKPVRGQQVSFSVVSTKALTLNITQAVSDADGVVSTSVNSGAEPTTFRVKAVLANTMSTMSDTVTVTTGQPSAIAMSLSVETSNIEGLDYDDVRTAVTVLVADQFGNPVADGMPVVFQTDNGAIGSSDRGGCTTVNGKCSVEFRSQNPRTVLGEAGKLGVATITATLSSGSETLTKKSVVTMSGSEPDEALFSGAIPLERSMDDCRPETVILKLADKNGNPLPAKTTVSVTDVSNLDAKIIGPGVPNLPGIHSFTQHKLEIIPQNCIAPNAVGPRKTIEGKFGLSVRTPLGTETIFYPFKRTYLVANSQ